MKLYANVIVTDKYNFDTIRSIEGGLTFANGINDAAYFAEGGYAGIALSPFD